MSTIGTFRGNYYFLSNFYLCQIEFEGITYPSSEHAFQAAKTLDMDRRAFIATRSSPGSAKIEGRRVRLRKDWERVKIDIMKDILRIKFTNPTLKKKLLDTGQAILCEGNNWGDTFWGICKGKGTNHLGRLLMQIREELR